MEQQQRDALEGEVLAILKEAPGGLSEYQLINRLRDGGHPAFQGSLSGDHLSLFRIHFLLFHVLYRLRERLWRQRRSELRISPLRIALAPYRDDGHGERRLGRRDPLCEYYLDPGHLETTTTEQVETLLRQFWSGSVPADRRGRALHVMGLADPVDDGTIRRRYRRLVMEHHPDRGGDTERLQAVNAAMEVLMPAR